MGLPASCAWSSAPYAGMTRSTGAVTCALLRLTAFDLVPLLLCPRPSDTDGSFTGRGRPSFLASYSPTNDTGPGPTCVPSANTTCAPFNWWRVDDSCVTADPMG